MHGKGQRDEVAGKRADGHGGTALGEGASPGGERPPRPGGGLFLSYRRSDTAGHAGRLYDRLATQFGYEQVFLDVTDIAPGADFVARIHEVLGGCDAIVVLIGPGWLGVLPDGRRRIDDEEDFVRLEITEALAQGVAIVPVLIAGATMPPAEDLPADLRPLSRINALPLDDQRWDYDVGRLMATLAPLLLRRPSRWQRWRRSPVFLWTAIPALALAIALLTMQLGGWRDPETTTVEFAAGRGTLEVPSEWSQSDDVPWLEGPDGGTDDITAGRYFIASVDTEEFYDRYPNLPGAQILSSDGQLVEWLGIGSSRTSRETGLETYLQRRQPGACTPLDTFEGRNDDVYMIRQDYSCASGNHLAKVATIGYDDPAVLIVDVVHDDVDTVERVLATVQLNGASLLTEGSARGPTSDLSGEVGGGPGSTTDEATGARDTAADLEPTVTVNHDDIPMAIDVPGS
jgi:hypothetical protein